MLLRALTSFLALTALLVAPTPAAAAVKDMVMNKEGYWGIDVDNGACAASMTLQGGAVFLLRAVDGGVTFALFGRTPLVRGKTGRIETEAYGVDFKPSYGEDATALYYNGELDARALAALRLARQVRILTDGRAVASMTFEGTGFESALDGVIACSKGESGWWGKGVQQTAEAAPEMPFNKEGVWSMRADDEMPGVCSAVAEVEGGLAFVLVAADGKVGFGVGSNQPLKRGRKAVFATEAYSFEFRPDYQGKDYFAGDNFLDSQAMFTLRRAKQVRITVDGREVLSMVLEGSGHAEVLTDLVACSRGEKGWWGAGAKVG
ncbi:MAG: hypothetical protein KKE02_00920 [Alphaproteobacteria bacterium]|nr:hypothetical protein [Alphaproteobacteria bacterium]MBU1515751.1 hypothetical protein [Alphaproteobacteria bacterium]MBU2097034.1 hypothetical protein [Alphaproteobacteria bacterium]MBU2149550.1 hypothetical protein [Alphaproteobacteria bacterium]MBU2308936.1 hypothetical protein [Alphaproteobacteria bacterium]